MQPAICLIKTHEGCVLFGMDLIKLDFDCLGRLPALADANMKYKRFWFDGHVSMLQLRAGIQAEKYQDRSRSAGELKHNYNCTSSSVQELQGIPKAQTLPYSMLPGCVTVSPAGIPPWLRPRQLSNY